MASYNNNTAGYRQRPHTEGGVARSHTQPLMRSHGHVGRNELVPKSIIGYSGYIPGVMAENVFGSTFSVAKEKAMVACTVRDQFHQPMSYPRAPSHLPPLHDRAPRTGHVSAHGPSRIADSTTGYTGHVPTKKAENVIGDTFARANQQAYQTLRDRWDASHTHGAHHYPYLGSTGCSYHNTNTGFYPPNAQRPAYIPSNEFTACGGHESIKPAARRLWTKQTAGRH